jgi:hypothetical protein
MPMATEEAEASSHWLLSLPAQQEFDFLSQQEKEGRKSPLSNINSL